eukprot:g2567.t1
MGDCNASCPCQMRYDSADPKQRRISLCRSLGSSTAKHLLAVVQVGDARETKRLLKAGARVNGDEREAWPPIVSAAMSGRNAVVRVLLKAGADVNVAVSSDVVSKLNGELVIARGQRALHAAALRLHAETVRLLLDSGADVNAVDHEGCTPLRTLCQTHPRDDDLEDSKRISIAQQLLQGGADLQAADNNGYYPVHCASQYENTALLDFILGASPSELDRRSNKDGMTPLCFSAMLGRASVVTHLLSRGARQPAAYDLECSHGCRHVLECPLRQAVQHGHEDVVRVFLDGGVEAIGGLDGCLDTALRYTMPRWLTRITLMLLAAEGPEGEHRWANSTFEGISVLHTAASYNALPIISVLLRAGADETAVVPTGETPHDAVGRNVDDDDNTRATGDPVEEAAVHRMLARAPAYRARSFLWPTTAADDNGGVVVIAAADSGGFGEDGGGGVNAAACSSGSEARDVPLRVCIWRARRRELLVRLISRHALKGAVATENQLVVPDGAVDGLKC